MDILFSFGWWSHLMFLLNWWGLLFETIMCRDMFFDIMFSLSVSWSLHVDWRRSVSYLSISSSRLPFRWLMWFKKSDHAYIVELWFVQQQLASYVFIPGFVSLCLDEICKFLWIYFATFQVTSNNTWCTEYCMEFYYSLHAVFSQFWLFVFISVHWYVLFKL